MCNSPLSKTTNKNSHLSVEGLLDFNLDEFDDFEFKESEVEKFSHYHAALNDFSGQELCVPNDSIEDLEWFPNFSNEPISLNGILSDESASFSDFPITHTPRTPEQKTPENRTKKNSKENFVGPMRNKKSRTKSVGGRAWGCMKNYFSPTVETGVAVGRKCSHCQVDKTPQWRTGPLGPKTLCNACGVRFKSGRLVPEYRPVASPSFDMQVHSNSHKKIMKMRVMKDVSEISDASYSGGGSETSLARDGGASTLETSYACNTW